MSHPKKRLAALQQQLNHTLLNKKTVVQHLLISLLARGHLLFEDLPGVGKTMLAKTLAQCIQGSFKRVQSTPDLLPNDITGVSIYNQKNQTFEFMPGPVFTNVLLVDEINRAPARTQSALLEAMAEGQISAEGKSWPLPNPFMVLATQNPIEQHGTYPLPEAQMDRFFMRLSIGYPSADAEIQMLQWQRKNAYNTPPPQALISLEDIVWLQDQVSKIEVHADVARYLVDLVAATRTHPEVSLGAGPRGTLALQRAAQSLAFLAGRDFVTATMVQQLAVPVLSHRLILRNGSNSLEDTQALMQKIIKEVPVAASSSLHPTLQASS